MINSQIHLGDRIASRFHLRRRGDEWFGLCPFSCSHVASFHVVDDGEWRCSICHRAGTPWSLIEQIDRVALPEAIELLDGRPIRFATDISGNRRLRSDLTALNTFAAQFFHAFLKTDPSAQRARTYLHERGIDPFTIDAFQIGYAANTAQGKHEFMEACRAAGFHSRLLTAAGLIITAPDANYPFFRNRVIVPMKSEYGDTIGFGGRTLGKASTRKYVNTATTAVHRKGASLFGLDRARTHILQNGEAIIVEGYFDTIAMHIAGFQNTVGSLGTSFTEEQLHALRRLGVGVAACFDPDAAGERAAKKSAEMAARFNVRFRRITLPQNFDPDDMLRHNGKTAFLALLIGSDYETNKGP